MGSRLGLIAFIFPFLSIFLSVFWIIKLKICITVFSGTIEARVLKFGICLHEVNEFVVFLDCKWGPLLLFFSLFIRHFFCLSI